MSSVSKMGQFLKVDERAKQESALGDTVLGAVHFRETVSVV
jgi:hypothetical protein